MATPISCTLLRRLSRTPSCWIERSWAAHRAICAYCWRSRSVESTLAIAWAARLA